MTLDELYGTDTGNPVDTMSDYGPIAAEGDTVAGVGSLLGKLGKAKTVAKNVVAPVRYAKAVAHGAVGFVKQAPSGEWRIDTAHMLEASGIDPAHLNEQGGKIYMDLIGLQNAAYATREAALHDLALVAAKNGIQGSTIDAVVSKLMQRIETLSPRQQKAAAVAGLGLGAGSYLLGRKLAEPDTASAPRVDPGVPAGWIPPTRANTLPPQFDYSIDDEFADEED